MPKTSVELTQKAAGYMLAAANAAKKELNNKSSNSKQSKQYTQTTQKPVDKSSSKKK